MTFHSPIYLLALLAIPLYVWYRARGRGRIPVGFSSTEQIQRIDATLFARLRWIVPALRCLAIGVLCVALARPQKGDEQTRIFAEGIAIQMVVDVSSSMSALDFEFEGQRADRLEAVKRVFRDFVQGRGELGGRDQDIIGMITFAHYPDSVCPLTLDHHNLLKILETVHTVRPGGEEDGTAVGDGIALGLERLRSLSSRQGGAGQEIKSKVMILLTDGRQTVPDSLNPIDAAQAAAELGIKVYAIGAGTPGLSVVPIRDERDRIVRYQRVPLDLDEETLKEVAQITGGRYFRATDAASLQGIYAEIDELEKTKTEERRFMQYKELYPPLLWLALGLIGVEVLLVNTRVRSIP